MGELNLAMTPRDAEDLVNLKKKKPKTKSAQILQRLQLLRLQLLKLRLPLPRRQLSPLDLTLFESFEATMQKIIDWTDKYMAACEYTINKKKAKGQKGTVKDRAKFTKKWKKVVGALHHGAVN